MRAPSICLSFVAMLLLAASCAISQQGSQPSMDERFQRLDRDRDGKLTPQELPGEWFGRLDTNKDGVVTLGEAKAAMAAGSGPQAQPPAPATAAPPAPDFTIDDVLLTAPGDLLSDPEFNDEQHRVTYWDYSTPGNVKVYVGELDPKTGLFRNPSGRDYLIAEHVSPFFRDGKWWAHNGPEWGRDQRGWSVYFVKEDIADVRQVWRAVPSPAGYEAQQLSTLAGGGCGPVCSQDPADAETRLLLFAPDREVVCWTSSGAPDALHELPGFRDYPSIAHWVPGTKWAAYVRRVGTPPAPQLVYLDTETGVVHQVSDEPGDKYDPWGFHAPQFGGEILMMCVVDRQQLAVYRDTGEDGKPWTRIATLSLPASSPHRYMYSTEPIAPASGVSGDVWFSLNANAEVPGRNLGNTGRTAKDGSIWVLNLGHETAPRVARRVDEGALSGIQTVRYESETMLGASEVFVYYERKSPETGRGEVRRCRTGIRLSAVDTPQALPTNWDQDFVPDAPFVGEIKGSYVDPEFSEGANQVVFQDTQNRVWIGDIDPTTGLFRTATGRDYLMDENITIIFDRPPQGRKFSTNGPEWTRDDQGYCVVYTKVDAAGIMQQWLARLIDGRSVVTQLTHGATDCYGNMPSRFQDGKPPRIAYTYDWPIWNAKAAWIFVDKPDEPHQLAGFDYRQMSMWSAVSPEFLFVQRREGSPYGQVAKANADTGKVQVLTNDEGQKDDPGLFAAPEFGGEICLMANVDNRAIAIYRDLKSPDGFWTRVATLTLPDEFPYQFISSPEPIAPATGLGGTSYVALLARESKDRNSPGSIWVLGLGKDPENRVVRRIDHAANLPAPATVLEPEPYVGATEAYVYYNAFDRATGQYGLRRAATGIRKGEQ